MDIGTIVLIAIVAAALIGLLVWRYAANSSEERAQKRKEAEELEAQRKAEQERRKREEWARQEELRRAEESATIEARERMVIASEELEQVQGDFRKAHDLLLDLLVEQAKQGCDAQFQQRFGITRRPQADKPEDDAEVQEYLRSNYAALRDAALDAFTDRLVEAEVDRRLALEEDDENADTMSQPEEEAAPGLAAKDVDEQTPTEEQDDAQASEEPDNVDAPDATSDNNAAASEKAEAAAPEEDKADAPSEDADDSEDDEADAKRQAIEKTVRTEFDFDSARTYGLAAISAHFNDAGELVGDIPWPAFTKPSKHGYGELHLVAGAPTEAQDDYREFAWKKFHTGRRAERPEHGEYSWGADHLLGDIDAGLSVETPVGALTIEGPSGPLALREMTHCPWVRHDLAYQELLLVPDGQRTVFASLLGLRKGDKIRVQLDGPEGLLQEVEGASFAIAGVGECEGSFVGLSASNPEAAPPGDAPYQLVERDSCGFTFELTADARPFDADTFPQFIEATVAWCAAPSPKPERLIRHVAR